MSRTTYNQSLNKLKEDIVKMGDLVFDRIGQAIEAFQTNNLELARHLIKTDDEVDNYEEDIAKQCINIIWKEQPIATDLRLVTGILKMVTDLERIGDHVVDISEITLDLAGHQFEQNLSIITTMVNQATKMIKDSVDALVNIDVIKARLTIENDDIIDENYSKLIKAVSDWIKTNPIGSENVISILLVGKYLERVADHSVNIAEWVIFIATGTHKRVQLF